VSLFNQPVPSLVSSTSTEFKDPTSSTLVSPTNAAQVKADRNSIQSYASSNSIASDYVSYESTHYGTPSVEEPIAYGKRLLDFFTTIFE
jgi:hypothetical protein